MTITPTPSPDTWQTNQLITADLLNSNIRDAQRFLAHAPLTIVSRAATQNVTTSTPTAVTWDTEVLDIDGMITVPSTSLTVRRPGIYAIYFANNFVANTGGDQRSATIVINGSGIAQQVDFRAATVATVNCVSAIVALNVGDVITCNVYQDSGVTLTIGGNYNAPRLAVRPISTAQLDIDYGTGGTSNPKPPPSPPPTGHVPTNYTKTYWPTWSRTFDGDNSITWDDSAYCYQGYYDGNRGNTRSLVGFNSTAIASDLSGATNIRVKVTFKVAHSYYNSGLTAVVGTHTYGSKPSTWSDASVNQNLKQKGSCSEGHSYTIDFGANTSASNSFKSWAKGIAFGPGPSTSRTYYGYMYGASQGGKPYLTVTYTK
ncbi:MAG TPA: hypothetical protein VIV60_25675 [Polyangiaceae bacterium]